MSEKTSTGAMPAGIITLGSSTWAADQVRGFRPSETTFRRINIYFTDDTFNSHEYPIAATETAVNKELAAAQQVLADWVLWRARHGQTTAEAAA